MPRVSKKQLEVINVEDEEDYITARTKLNTPEDKIEDTPIDKPIEAPEINERSSLISAGEKAKLFTPPEDKPIEIPEDKPIEIPPEDKPIEEEIEEIIPESNDRRSLIRDGEKTKLSNPPENNKRKPNYDKTTCPDCGRLVSQKTLRYTHKYQCPSKPHPAHITEEKPHIIKTETQVHSPAKATIMQTPYAQRQRYEHINLF